MEVLTMLDKFVYEHEVNMSSLLYGGLQDAQMQTEQSEGILGFVY